MRNLTIARHKSFVGSMGTDKVYIRDEQSSELTIEGVPCRMIGEIKNGETKTFLIPEEEQQIFLIADKLSKERCNASLVIPEGQEDVSFSGKHHFVLGSNPFRFDGVPLSAEQIAKQKKQNRKSVVIFVCAIIIGLLVGTFIGKIIGTSIGKIVGGAISNIASSTDSPKTFTKEDFEITLTDAFNEVQEPGFFACYNSKTVMVFALREDKALFDDITFDEYCTLLEENNSQQNIQSHKKDGLTWYDYTYTAEEQELYYMAFCYEGEEAFWAVNFVTPIVNREEYTDTFLQWAKTLKVG